MAHEHVIDEAKTSQIKLLDEDTNQKMAVLFKMFSDPTRIKIMHALLNNELNVCEIASLLNMTHSAISHQLATLKANNLVKATKRGKEVYYALADGHIYTILFIGKEHAEEDM